MFTWRRNERAVDDSSVAGIMLARWGVRARLAHQRFESSGWWYEAASPSLCPTCRGALHALRKLYDGPDRKPDKPSYLVAVVCPSCPATFTLQQLRIRGYAALMEGEPAGERRRPPQLDCDVRPGEVRTSSLSVAEAAEFLQHLSGRPGARVIAASAPFAPAPATGTVVEQRLLYWRKITDPRAPVPAQAAAADCRVLLPMAARFDPLCGRLRAAGVPFRQVRYWCEAETLSTIGARGELQALRVTTDLAVAAGSEPRQTSPVGGPHAAAARDCFELVWDIHAAPVNTDWTSVDAVGLIPREWLRYLPYPQLNPAQADAAPHVVNSNGHLIVTAPTGAGKTVIGMLAALKSILGAGRKAAWLVPQRSLTEELDRDLDVWRAAGLRVEKLTGEYATDVEKIRQADLWVATTEKFEAICRAASLRTALAEVGCLVVDEIHLLGSQSRGPLLEALLARMRGEDSAVRIVGLSATVANADQIAAWLGAQQTRTTWRPSRLTWQLPTIPVSADRAGDQSARSRLATEITAMVAQDGGSVLVFCGSKRNVRATALAIATSRGANTHGVSPDDTFQLHRVCESVRVGVHYKDWEYKRDSERGFRNHELDVLVATTTVAAGVNLPARAVVVRDTQIGLDEIDVATVQQMFGRAGRVGAGETEGWAYLIVDETERAGWQARLVEGYTVTSHLADHLLDHLLAEAAQGRVRTVRDAENWWARSLAHYQGTEDLEPVRTAVGLLIQSGYLIADTTSDAAIDFAVTELGVLTTRLMVPVPVGIRLRELLARVPAPADAEQAEQVLGRAIATLVPQLAEAPVSDALRPMIAHLLHARGHLGRLRADAGSEPAEGPATCDPGDLARAAFALVANSPQEFTRTGRVIAGIPTAVLLPILSEAPRYFTWLAAQGHLGTVPPWVAVVAGDLGRRIEWRRLGPPRGSGRLLWMCEQMAGPVHLSSAVPELFPAARGRGLTAPDWPAGRPPGHCRLDRDRYAALLTDRATDITITEHDGYVAVTCPSRATVAAWAGRHYETVSGAGHVAYPAAHPDAPEPAARGVTVFTRRGDYRSTGWLALYNSILH